MELEGYHGFKKAWAGMLIVEGFWLCKEMWCMSEAGWGFSEKEDDQIAEYIITYKKKNLLGHIFGG